MPEDRMVVTFGAINEAAMDTDSIATQISQQLEELKSYLSPLIASWSGEAAGDFQALQAKWDNSANDLNLVLRQVSQALRSAGEQYQATENANSSLWT